MLVMLMIGALRIIQQKPNIRPRGKVFEPRFVSTQGAFKKK
jgi:hypothetical protein